jgi:hypothetical protein
MEENKELEQLDTELEKSEESEKSIINEGGDAVGEVQAEETEDGSSKEEVKEEVQPVVPEKYEFELPEGIVLNEELTNKATEVFKELKLSNEQAQKLVNIQSDTIMAMNKANQDFFISTVNEWKNETKKQLGDKYDSEMAFAKKAFKEFGNEELSKMADEFGIGNHPAFINMLIGVGKKISEDKPPVANPGTNKKDFLKELYG